jgi:hypothetical protein
MMKHITRFFPVLLLSLLLLPGLPQTGQAQTDDTCTLPELYDETSRENNLSLIRLFGMLGNDGVLDREQENAALYFEQMRSMRTYYERQSETLPDCLQAINTAYIRTLSAAQDVLTYNIAMRAWPQRADGYRHDASDARADLNTEFSIISDFYRQIESSGGVLP